MSFTKYFNYLFCCGFFITNFSHLFSLKAQPVDSVSYAIHLDFDNLTPDLKSFLPYREVSRPKIGLALSGGGARGMAHIGVLKALEKQGIPIDFIAGTSIGSVVGGLYASGYNPDEIENIMLNINWDTIISDNIPRRNLFLGQKQQNSRHIFQLRFDGLKPALPTALSSGQRMMEIISDITMQANFHVAMDFNKLKIPFRSVTTDLVTGNRVVLGSGNLAEAIRASLTIPLLVSPIEKDGMLLVDGGMISNIPVDAVREMGADIVIAVDLAHKPRATQAGNAEVQIPVIVIVTPCHRPTAHANEHNTGVKECAVLIFINLRDLPAGAAAVGVAC